MKRVFVDTNIILDLLADRKPHSKFAVALFEKAEDQQVKLYVSSHSLATTYYLLKKHIDEKKLKTILLELLEFVTVIAIDGHVIRRGLKSVHRDFEDAIQIIAATSVDKMDCIVTRNLRDFKESEIPVFSPDNMVDRI
jgi:predicted nucleic acid-binding protein